MLEGRFYWRNNALLLLRFVRFLARVKLERDAVHAIALTGRLRPVVEDMAEMPAATLAMHLGADHEKAAVGRRLGGSLKRRREARPAGAACELGPGVEHRMPESGAMVDDR